MLSDFFYYSLRIQIQYSQPKAESVGGSDMWVFNIVNKTNDNVREF